MKGILIDAYNTNIREVEVPKGIQAIYDLIHVETFECVRIDENNICYVDEKGLINGTRVGFMLSFYPQPLMGSGLILGCNEEGESVDTTLTVERVQKKMVSWVGIMDPRVGKMISSLARDNVN